MFAQAGKKKEMAKSRRCAELVSEPAPKMGIKTVSSCHVEVVSLLQRLSNTRPKAITLDVEMEDYYRIKGARTND